jgi:hypothetical protein
MLSKTTVDRSIVETGMSMLSCTCLRLKLKLELSSRLDAIQEVRTHRLPGANILPYVESHNGGSPGTTLVSVPHTFSMSFPQLL